MKDSQKNAVIIVAAGNGMRFGDSNIPKQYQPINGKTILEYNIDAFSNCPEIDLIQIVYNIEHQSFIDIILEKHDLLQPVQGGKTRQISVLQGLKALEGKDIDKILIHDAARPNISLPVITEVLNNISGEYSVIPALKVSDSLKYSDSNIIEKSIDRENLYRSQTPQGFKFKKLFEAHNKLKGQDFSDDAAMIENIGGKIKIISDKIDNIKLTNPEDLKMMQKLLGNTPDIRTGFGYDVHQLVKPENDRKLYLCGIEINHELVLKGHSDADVAMHALTDALLGAIGEGDIGEHFPPSDNQWKDVDSQVFLEHAYNLIKEKNGTILNIDLTIICEKPKMLPYKKLMKQNLSNILNLEIDRINIKATTTEKLGFAGRMEGIEAKAIATIIIA